MARKFHRPFVAAVLCAALVSAHGWIGTAAAADDEWPTWPRPKAAPEEVVPQRPPGPETPPAPTAPKPGSEAAAGAGEAAGKKTDGGIKAGTVAKAALIAAGIAGIAIAVGGGGSSSNH